MGERMKKIQFGCVIFNILIFCNSLPSCLSCNYFLDPLVYNEKVVLRRHKVRRWGEGIEK